MAQYTVTTAQNIDVLSGKTGTRSAVAWTRSGTTATVTITGHAIANGNIVYVTVTSDAAAITLGAKTVAGAAANTFTFTCLNAGAASGTLTLTGGDYYLINGGTLTIDQDSRVGLTAGDATVMDNITLSATLGGTVEVDARYVRLIPYNTGASTVPASGTAITQGSASGTLIGIYASLGVAATAAGAAMPATGYVKIKAWNSVAFAAGALTGISATATGADVAGWIELVGIEASTITVPRLGLFRMRGEWYNVGTTTGSSATTYQIPSNGMLVYIPAIWVESSTPGVYEQYVNAGSQTALLANIATDAVRGKVFWCSTAGLIRFQNDGTNSTGGYLPPTGRNIRIPNIICNNCATATKAANILPSATLATRYDFTTTGGGVISLDKALLNWYPSFAQAFSLSMSSVGIMTAITISEIASEMTLSDIVVGQETPANTQTGLTMATCLAGGTISDIFISRINMGSSGNYAMSMTDISGFTFNNMKGESLTIRGNATSGIATIIRAADCIWDTPVLIGGRVLLTTCTNCEFNNTIYADHQATTTTTSNPHYIYDLSTKCVNILIDGLTFGGLFAVQPYSGILNVGTSACELIKLRNIGTYAAPLSLGQSVQAGVAWSRVTTTATVTRVAHGLKVNDIVYVIISDVIAAIIVGAKTVASVPTADTFTFTCLNAGATSGVLTYELQVSALLFALASGAAANDVRIQRCYVDQLRTNLWSGDNSSKNLLMESISDFTPGSAAALTYTTTSPTLNNTARSIASNHAMSAQTSVYGTHWFEAYLRDVSTANLAGVAWTRATTTATVTSTAHRLITGTIINVTVTSASAAIILGQKTITVLTENTFTFTCLNAGAASGTLTFEVFSGRLGLLMNEATAETADQYVIDSGTPAFTSAGGLYMPSVGQQITFELPYYSIGITSFPIAEAVMAGGAITNHDIFYALDLNDGTGYGSFHNLYYSRAGGSGSNGQFTFTVTNATGVEVGDYAFGTNVGILARVTQINSNTITVDIANTGTVSGIIRFNHMPYETSIDPSLGFKMKIRILTQIINVAAITSLYVWTKSTDASRAYQYPLDVVPVTVTALDAADSSPVENARVLLRVSNGTIVTITRASSTATVAHTAHGYRTGKVVISGANQGEYNGVKSITVVDEDSYTFSVTGTPTTPATGTINSYRVILEGLTDSDGQLTDPEIELVGETLDVTGTARKGTAAPFYKASPISGEIDDSGLELTTYLVSDD